MRANPGCGRHYRPYTVAAARTAQPVPFPCRHVGRWQYPQTPWEYYRMYSSTQWQGQKAAYLPAQAHAKQRIYKSVTPGAPGIQLT